MRYAIVADLHGKRGRWRQVSAAAGRAGADLIMCLGDYLECEVPNRRHDPSRRWPRGEVVKDDPRLWRSLAAEAELVLGNQETRIRDLLQPDQVPDDLAPLLATPEQRRFGAAWGEHGHRLAWSEQPDGRLLPELAEVFPERLRVVGHTHQTLLLDVAPGPGGGVRLERLAAPAGTPVPLPPGGHLFANVNQARGHPSHWLLYDDDREEIVFHEVHD